MKGGSDSSMRSPPSSTSASGTRTTRSPAVWPRPGWISSTARSPRSSCTAEEKVWVGRRSSVARISSRCGSSTRCGVRLERAGGRDLDVVARPVGGVDRHLAELLHHRRVAEVVVPVLVGVDEAGERSRAEAAYVVGHDARLRGRAVGVDHEQAVGAADEGDVDVHPVVVRHPHAWCDLGEPRVGSGMPGAYGLLVGLALTANECQTSARECRRVRRGIHGRRPQARRAARDRGGLRRHRGARRLQGAGRAARPGGLAGDGAQRHGGAGGGGLHPPAPHQRGPGADRQGLPPLRRQARHPQADEHGRAARHLHPPRQCGRPRRRGAEVGAAAEPADPPGRDRAISLALALHGAPRRARGAHPDPRDGDPDPQHRSGRAAPGGARGALADTDLADCGPRSTASRGRADRRARPRSWRCPTTYARSRPTPRARSRPSSPTPCPTTAATSASR